MTLRRFLFLVVAAGAGAVVYRRRAEKPERRVDLYFDDGSMLNLPQESPEGEELLSLAADVLARA